MKAALFNALLWFRHGIRILVSGFCAYVIVGLAIGLPMKFLDSSNPYLQVLGVVCALVGIPAGIALFGYLFTRFYTYTTWGHKAAQDMKTRQGTTLSRPTLPPSIIGRSRGAPTGS
jgi:hypothetical protein